VPTVVSVTPANGATRVADDQSVQVELTRADSTDYQKTETSQADFAAGTLAALEVRPTGDLILASGAALSFPYAGGSVCTCGSGFSGLSARTVECWVTVNRIGVVQGVYTTRIGGGNGGFTLRISASNQFQAFHAGATPNSAAQSASALTVGVPVHVAAVWDGSYLQLYWNGVADGSPAANGTPTTGTTFVVGAEDGATTYANGLDGRVDDIRIWDYARTAAEIAAQMSIQLTGSETGLIGYWKCNEGTGATAADSTSANHPLTLIGSTGWSTSLPFSPQGSYKSSGSRISPAYALATVGHFGAGVVQYDATVPANTTLTVKISKDGANWTTVASGDHIALWTEGDNLASEHIYTRAELATTDVAATPVLSEVRLIFMAVDASLVEITVDGVSFKVSEGNLEAWHTAKVTAGPVIVDPCTQDLFVGTRGQWYAYGGRSCTVLVKYAGTTISTTTFTNERCETYAAWLPFAFFVGVSEDMNLVRGEFHYQVQEIVRQGMDARYWVAYASAWDTPVAGIVGQPVPNDTPLSGVVRGWLLGDTPASGIVQGWMWDDTPLSGIFALPVAHDEAVSGIVGLPIETAGALSGVVYEVNENNVIELRVISVAEAAALTALGIVIQ
jgi:hypothetical protein